MKQNADHIQKQARKYVQMLWPEELVAITPDTIITTRRYIKYILPVCPSFFFLYSGSGSFQRVSYQTNNRYFRLKKSYEMQLYADIYLLLNYSTFSGVHPAHHQEYIKL